MDTSTIANTIYSIGYDNCSYFVFGWLKNTHGNWPYVTYVPKQEVPSQSSSCVALLQYPDPVTEELLSLISDFKNKKL